MNKFSFLSLLVLICNTSVAQDKTIDPIFFKHAITDDVPITLITNNPNVEEENFENYITWIIPKWNEIHELYANQITLAALRKKSQIPPGAVIVSKVYKPLTKYGEYVMKGGKYVKGGFIRKDVMEKQSKWGDAVSPDFRTGNWNYASFKSNVGNEQIKVQQEQCISCHLSRKEEDYLFSKKELTEYISREEDSIVYSDSIKNIP